MEKLHLATVTHVSVSYVITSLQLRAWLAMYQCPFSTFFPSFLLLCLSVDNVANDHSSQYLIEH